MKLLPLFDSVSLQGRLYKSKTESMRIGRACLLHLYKVIHKIAVAHLPDFELYVLRTQFFPIWKLGCYLVIWSCSQVTGSY
jgi:hypothetical protein